MVTDWLTDWLVSWSDGCVFNLAGSRFELQFICPSCLLGSLLIRYVHMFVCCWVVSSLCFRLIALPFLQSDLSCERNSSRPSCSKWIVSNKGGILPHCKRNYSGYRLPVVQENCSQRNFYPYYNCCEKCRGMKFTFHVKWSSFPLPFLYRSFPVPSFWCILYFPSVLNPKCYNLYLSPNIFSLGCF